MTSWPRDRRGARSRRWACALLLAAAGSARADFVVLNGAFAGSSATATAFQVTAHEFDVTAELVASNESEWSYASCPPRHVGRQPLEGKLVLFDSLQLSCSRKQLAQVLIGQRAAGLLVLGPSGGLLPPVPGRWYYSHSTGEDRTPLPFPMAHVIGTFPHEVYASVVAGAKLRARVTPSENAWLRVWGSAWWAAWQAGLTLQSAVVFELAACRLYAFIMRESGRPQLTIPQALLFVEAVAHAQRIAYMAVDPYWSRGVYSEQLALWLIAHHLAYASLGRALFLVYFAQAADLSGTATFRIAHRFWATAVIGTCCAILVLDAVTNIFTLRSVALISFRGAARPRAACRGRSGAAARGASWAQRRSPSHRVPFAHACALTCARRALPPCRSTSAVFISGTLVPFIELVLYLMAYRRVTRKLKGLPVTLLNKVKTVIGRSCVLSAFALGFGSLLLVAVDNPLSQALVVFAFRSFINAASCLQVRTRRGLPAARRAACEAACALLQCLHASRSPSRSARIPNLSLHRPRALLARRCSCSSRWRAPCQSARSASPSARSCAPRAAAGRGCELFGRSPPSTEHRRPRRRRPARRSSRCRPPRALRSPCAG